PEQAALIKRGVVQNELPPVLVHVPGEEQAISRTIRMVREDDTLLFLSEQAAPVRSALRGGSALAHAS
ncbi:MAG TPA: hypothetical protein VGR16_12190, partial [Thermomicrobiales bacterium]|nr:hypothetical protein [Thermomicrobiales bacterium]